MTEPASRNNDGCVVTVAESTRTLVRVPALKLELREPVQIPRAIGGAIPRNESIDVVRFFAAAAVVFVHCAESPALDLWNRVFRFAVPFYLFASLYYQSLSLRLNPDRPLTTIIFKRFKRLYLPFLAWSAIYLVARDLKRATLLHLSPLDLHPRLLWTGTEYHLWFLPYLLAASIFLAVVHRLVLQRDARWRWPLIVAAIVAAMAMGMTHIPRRWDETFNSPTFAYIEWWRSGPTIWLALAFAWLTTLGTILRTVSPAVGLAGLAFAIVSMFKQGLDGFDIIPRALCGLGLIVAALAPWRGKLVDVLARLGRYGYGVYLCHVLIVESFHVVIARLHAPESAWLDLANFVVSFAGALLFVRLLACSKKLAWLNG